MYQKALELDALTEFQAPLPARRRPTTGPSPMLSSGAMTHVFISPHPDDAALSCGGLIASLRELGQNVAIIIGLLRRPARWRRR